MIFLRSLVIGILIFIMPLQAGWAALDYAKQSLIESDFSNRDLRGVTFNLTNLRNANLSGSDLQGASLFGAKLQQTNLSNTNLREATLDSAVLDECGSCSIQHINYDFQWELKVKHLRDVLFRIGNIDFPINLSMKRS